jgi:hypothetical protein
MAFSIGSRKASLIASTDPSTSHCVTPFTALM